jgi:hypothetical protein
MRNCLVAQRPLAERSPLQIVRWQCSACCQSEKVRDSHFISACIALIAANALDRRDILSMSNEPHSCTRETYLVQRDLLDTIAACVNLWFLLHACSMKLCMRTSNGYEMRAAQIVVTRGECVLGRRL